jgi:predicted acyltransferase (DUF342 family)
MKVSFKFPLTILLATMLVLPVLAVAESSHSTVNKSIRISENSSTGDVDSVNGSIRIGNNSFVDSVESVNGSIKLGKNVTVNEGIQAVNGAINLNPGCEVGGNIETVNGGIHIQSTTVSGDIETINGKLKIMQGSEVAGNIVVRDSKGWSLNKRKPVYVEIGENVQIHGDLIFEQPVELKLHDSAEIGEIIGDDVELIDS